MLKRAEWAYSRSERGGKERMTGPCKLCGLVSEAFFFTSISTLFFCFERASKELVEELFDWSIWRAVWRLWKSYLEGCLEDIWTVCLEAAS
jgi:hypothetical protein